MEWNEKLVGIIQKIFWPLLGVGAVALVASFAWSYKKDQDYKNLVKKQDELFLIRQDVNKVTEAITPKEDPKAAAKKIADEKPKVSPEVQEKSYSEVVKKLQTFVQTNQGTESAVEAALLAVEITQDYNRSMSIEILTQALAKYPKEKFLYGVGQSQLGRLYAEEKKCVEAAQAWEKVFTEKAHSYLSGALRLKAGICYEKQNQLDKAEALYQEVVDKEPNSFSGRTAKKFLLHVKYLKSKIVAGA